MWTKVGAQEGAVDFASTTTNNLSHTHWNVSLYVLGTALSPLYIFSLESYLI